MRLTSEAVVAASVVGDDRRWPPVRPSGGAAPPVPLAVLTPIKLQLQWFPQAQFAGYFAALDQGFYKDRGSRRHDPAGRGRDRARRRSSPAATPSSASAGCRRCSPRASRARTSSVIGQVFQRSGDAPGLVGRTIEHHQARRLEGQEGRYLGLRQRGRAVRGLRKVGIDPAQRRATSPSSPQQFDMNRLPQRRDRRRPGDDLQRVRPGARGEEPEDQQALHSRGPQRHLDGAGRHGHAPGRDLRLAGLARRSRATRTSRSSSCGPRSRAGCSAATTRPSASTSS